MDVTSPEDSSLFSDSPIDIHEDDDVLQSGGGKAQEIVRDGARGTVAPNLVGSGSKFDKWRKLGGSYELKRILGQGSYGQVAEAVDIRLDTPFTLLIPDIIMKI